MEKLRENIQSLVNRTRENNLWRGRQCFNLIPSENTPSLLVKVCEISDPAGRYAEHRTSKGREIYYYQGIDFIAEVEEQLKEQMQEYFDCSRVEARPISGQMANEIVYKAVTKYVNRKSKKPFRRIKKVINNDLTKGGHLSSQPMGALFNFVQMDEKKKEQVVNIPLSEDNMYKPDVEKLKALVAEEKPELIIFGKSMFLYPEPVKEIAEVNNTLEKPAIIMFDMAHVLGLYGDAFQSPFQDGAHIVTGSTHKTFFGPQRGVIAANFSSEFKGLWTQIKSRAFPGSMSNHHLGTLVGQLMAAYEMNAFKDEYQTKVVANARAFAQHLHTAGLKVEGDEADGFTKTHQVVVRIADHGNGEEIARRLEDNNIIVNYQALPDDKSFVNSSGIRLGVSEMTRFGMDEDDFQALAGYMAEVIKENKDVKDKVAEDRKKYAKMRYCLPLEETLPLAVQVLESAMPHSDYAKVMAENLAKINQ